MMEAHGVEQGVGKSMSSDVHQVKVILTEVLYIFFNCKQRCPWRDRRNMEWGKSKEREATPNPRQRCVTLLPSQEG